MLAPNGLTLALIFWHSQLITHNKPGLGKVLLVDILDPVNVTNIFPKLCQFCNPQVNTSNSNNGKTTNSQMSTCSFYLITPFVNHRHVDVINKDSHFLPRWRTISGTHSFVYVTFYAPLEHIWQSCRRKVQTLVQVNIRIILAHVIL